MLAQSSLSRFNFTVYVERFQVSPGNFFGLFAFSPFSAPLLRSFVMEEEALEEIARNPGGTMILNRERECFIIDRDNNTYPNRAKDGV